MTPPETDGRFAVVQDDYQLKDWLAAAEVLTAVLGLPPVTARQQARRAHGFLAMNLPREPAERLRQALAEQGIAAKLVSQSEIVPVVKPLRVHQLSLTQDALCIQLPGAGAKTLLAWNTLRLIAATRATHKETFHHWKTSYDPRRADDDLRVTAYTEDYKDFLADIFAFPAAGPWSGVRLIARELNYLEALGEAAPDAMTEGNARKNGFWLLLSAIAARAPRAHISPESRALFGEPTPGGALTRAAEALEEFEARNRWLLQQLSMSGGDS